MVQVFWTTTTVITKRTFPLPPHLEDEAGSTASAGPINTRALQKNNPEPARFFLALSLCYCHCLDKSTELKMMVQRGEFVVMMSKR